MATEAAVVLMQRIEQLASISETPGMLVRRSYTPEMRRAHDLVGGWIEGGAQVLRRTATARCPSVDAEQGEPGEIGRLGLTKHLRK